MKADILTQIVLPFSLFIIMLGMGLSLKISDFTRVLQVPKAMIIGISCQMILLPLIGLAIVMAFSLPPELAVGFMILAFCPRRHDLQYVRVFGARGSGFIGFINRDYQPDYTVYYSAAHWTDHELIYG